MKNKYLQPSVWSCVCKSTGQKAADPGLRRKLREKKGRAGLIRRCGHTGDPQGFNKHYRPLRNSFVYVDPLSATCTATLASLKKVVKIHMKRSLSLNPVLRGQF